MKCAEVGSTTTLTQKSTCCKASRYFSLNVSKNSSRYLSSEYFHTNQEFLGFPIYLDFQSLHCKWTFLSSEVHLFPQIVSKVGGDPFLGFPIIEKKIGNGPSFRHIIGSSRGAPFLPIVNQCRWMRALFSGSQSRGNLSG